MELELFQAFRKAGIDEPTAQAAVESIRREIDRQFDAHANQLFTKADGAELRAELRTEFRTETARLQVLIAETKADLIKWCVGSIFASAALHGAVLKLIH